MRKIKKIIIPAFVICLALALSQTALASGAFRTTAGVNVRSSASTSSSTLTTIAQGESVDVLEHDPAGWSKVQAGGVNGYIRSDFLKMPVSDEPVIFYVTSDVNVRSLASVSSTPLAIVPQGSSVNVLEHDPAGWSKVQAGGYGGFIRSDLLEFRDGAISPITPESSTPSAESSDTGAAADTTPDSITGQLYTRDGVNLRSGASTSSDILDVLALGTLVDVIDNQSNGWSQVIYNGTVGYIRSDLLTQEPASVTQNGSVNPLTGESFDSARNPWNGTLNDNRPWVVSIGNTADAMPLWGISAADILIEFVVESVATRFLAVYQDVSNVGRIGGIRSLRTSSMEIAAGFDGIFAHWGGRTYDNAVTSGHPVTAFDTIDASSLGSRDPSKITQNSAIAKGSDLIQGLPGSFRKTHNGFKNGLTFTSAGAPKDGARAGTVTVSFSERTTKKTKFTYDTSQNKYYAFQYGTNLIDGNNSKKLSFTNILVLQTGMQFDYNASGHTCIETTGTGTGYYINGGKYTEITWSRDNVSSPYRFYAKDGSSLKLGVGKTYICIVESNQIPAFS